MRFTEAQLRRYAEPLGEAERQRCKNAIAVARDTLMSLGYTDDGQSVSLLFEGTLAYATEMRCLSDSRKIRLFVHGSCANDTNVCAQSDIDIAIMEETFPASGLETKAFKDKVEKCLRERFCSGVERKNKVIIIHGDMVQRDIDTVFCRKYFNDREKLFGGENKHVNGMEVCGDDGERLVCFPEQHIVNGRAKDAETNHNYKKMVRIIKEMRHLMEELDCASAREVSSYELESLLWNLPDELFRRYCFYRYLFDDIVEYIYRNDKLISDYKEVNGIKPLCPRHADRNKISDFIYDLRHFYEYNLAEA